VKANYIMKKDGLLIGLNFYKNPVPTAIKVPHITTYMIAGVCLVYIKIVIYSWGILHINYLESSRNCNSFFSPSYNM